MRISSFLVAAILSLGSSAATAETVKFCFTAPADFTDSAFPLANGTKEDYWQTSSAKPMYGVKAYVRPVGTSVVWDDFTDDGFGADGAGCTSSITATGTNLTYTIRVYFNALVQGNNLDGYNGDADISCYRDITYSNITGSGTKTISIVGSSQCKPLWRAMNTAAYGLYRHAGGMTGKSYHVVWCDGGSNAGCNAINTTVGTTITLSAGGTARKFTIAHELGHAISYAKDSALVSGDCSENLSTCPSDPNQAQAISHAMWSREHQSCAFREAFAHFYSADVFNSHNQSDCVFRYYKEDYKFANDGSGLSTVDCEASTPSTNFSVVDSPPPSTGVLVPAFMETNPCGSLFTNRGVEVDWFRQMWDTHTNSGPISFTDQINWARDAISSSTGNYFDALDAQANAVGGSLDLNWDIDVVANGVDH